MIERVSLISCADILVPADQDRGSSQASLLSSNDVQPHTSLGSQLRGPAGCCLPSFPPASTPVQSVHSLTPKVLTLKVSKVMLSAEDPETIQTRMREQGWLCAQPSLVRVCRWHTEGASLSRQPRVMTLRCAGTPTRGKGGKSRRTAHPFDKQGRPIGRQTVTCIFR